MPTTQVILTGNTVQDFMNTIRGIETFSYGGSSNPQLNGQIVAGLNRNALPSAPVVNLDAKTSGTAGAATYPGDGRATPSSYQVDLVNLESYCGFADYDTSKPKEIQFTKNVLSAYLGIDVDVNGKITSMGVEAYAVFTGNYGIIGNPNGFDRLNNSFIGQNISNFGKEQLSFYLAGRNQSDTTAGDTALGPDARQIPQSILDKVEVMQRDVASKFVTELFREAYSGNANNVSDYGSSGWANVETLYGSKLKITSSNTAFGVSTNDVFFGTFNRAFLAGVMYVKGPYGAEGRGFAKALLEAKNDTINHDAILTQGGITITITHSPSDGSFLISGTFVNVGAQYPAGWQYGALLSQFDIQDVNNFTNGLLVNPTIIPYSTSIDLGYASNILSAALDGTDILTQNSSAVGSYNYNYDGTKSFKISGDDSYVINSSSGSSSSTTVVVANSDWQDFSSVNLMTGGIADVSAIAGTYANFDAMKPHLYFYYGGGTGYVNYNNYINNVGGIKATVDAQTAVYLYLDPNGGTPADGYKFRVNVSNANGSYVLDPNDFIFTSQSSNGGSKIIDASNTTGSVYINVDSNIAEVKLGNGNNTIVDSNETITNYVLENDGTTNNTISGFDLNKDKIDVTSYNTPSVTIDVTSFNTHSDDAGSSTANFYKNYSYSAVVKGASGNVISNINISSDTLYTAQQIKDGIQVTGLSNTSNNNPPAIIANTTINANLAENSGSEWNAVTNKYTFLISSINATDADGNSISYRFFNESNSSYSSSLNTADGIFEISGNNIIFTPNNQNFYTTTPISMKVAAYDGTYYSTNKATVNLNISNSNDNPITSFSNIQQDSTYQILNGKLTINITEDISPDQVTVNLISIGKFSDPDQLNNNYSTGYSIQFSTDGVSYTSLATNGVLNQLFLSASISADGSLWLQQRQDFLGTISFFYRIVDSIGLVSNVQNVDLAINRVPNQVLISPISLTPYNEDDASLDSLKIGTATINLGVGQVLDSTKIAIINNSSSLGALSLQRQGSTNIFDILFNADLNVNTGGVSGNINYTVTYNGRSSGTINSPIIINPVNDLPTDNPQNIIIPNAVSLIEDSGDISSNIFTILSNIKSYFSDIETAGENLNISILSAINNGIDIKNQFNIQNGNLIFNAKQNFNGTVVVSVRVQDQDGGYIDRSLIIAIAPVADRAIINLPNNVFMVNGDNYAININVVNPDFNLIGSDALSLKYQGGLSIIDKFNYSVTKNTNETYNIALTPKFAIQNLDSQIIIKIQNQDGVVSQKNLNLQYSTQVIKDLKTSLESKQISDSKFSEIANKIGLDLSNMTNFFESTRVKNNIGLPINMYNSFEIGHKPEFIVNDGNSAVAVYIDSLKSPQSVALKWDLIDNAKIFNAYNPKISVDINGSERLIGVVDGGSFGADISMNSDSNTIAIEDNINWWGGNENYQYDRFLFGKINSIDGKGGDDFIDMSSNKYTLNDIILHGGYGDDYVWGGNGNDQIFGDAGNDQLMGGGGDDVIIGGTGKDVMYGQLGADTFKFNLLDSTTSDGFDEIMDFSSQQGDKINLNLSALGLSLGDISINNSGSEEYTVVVNQNSDFGIIVHSETPITMLDIVAV